MSAPSASFKCFRQFNGADFGALLSSHSSLKQPIADRHFPTDSLQDKLVRELAGERMKVALEANSYEDEHDCFSDNTHNSHYYNALGIQNVYTGTYKRIDGTELSGASLSDLVVADKPELNEALTAQLDASVAALGHMKQTAEQAENPVTFDMMIAPDNAEGAKIINDAIAALVEQTGSIEQVAAVVGVDSLEPDDAGHQF